MNDQDEQGEMTFEGEAERTEQPITTGDNAVAVRSEMGQLMQIALNSGSVYALEKLIALKNQQEEREAKRVFDERFAIMQKEFEPIKRSKQGGKSKYAPLEAITRQYGEIISRHGFSYRWTEEPIEGGGKRVRIIVSGHGHTYSDVYFDVPRVDPVKTSQGIDVQNAIQVAGVMSTYGRRYTFKSAFGIAEEDEDADGMYLTFDEGLEYAEAWDQFSTCNNIEQIKTLRTSLLNAPGNTNDSRVIITKLAKRRVAEIEKGGNKK